MLRRNTRMVTDYQVVDCGQLAREKQNHPKWIEYAELVKRAKAVVTDQDPAAGIRFLAERLQGGEEWRKVPYNHLMLSTVYAADNDDPIYDDIRLPAGVNDFINYNPAGAYLQTRRDLLRSELTDAFKKGYTVKSVGCGDGKAELLALRDSAGSNARLICIDKSPEALQSIRNNADKFGIGKRVSTMEQDALSPDWEFDGQVDVIVCVGFITDYLRGELLTGMFKKLLGGTKDGGRMITNITCPDTPFIDYVGHVLRWSVASISGKGLQTFTQEDFINHLEFLPYHLTTRIMDFDYGALCVLDKQNSLGVEKTNK